MKRVFVLTMAAIVLLLCCSCTQYEPLIVPGHSEFEETLKGEYDYISGIKCVREDPYTYSVRCRIAKRIEQEDMSSVIEALKDYALTSALEAYKVEYERDPDTIFLNFYVNSNTRIYFRYRYELTSCESPTWEFES